MTTRVHPPSDVRAGQQLVLEIYHALVHSPEWEDTLFVITYDEHGQYEPRSVKLSCSAGQAMTILRRCGEDTIDG